MIFPYGDHYSTLITNMIMYSQPKLLDYETSKNPSRCLDWFRFHLCKEKWLDGSDGQARRLWVSQSARRSFNLFTLVAIGIAPSSGNPFTMPRTKKLFALNIKNRRCNFTIYVTSIVHAATVVRSLKKLFRYLFFDLHQN